MKVYSVIVLAAVGASVSAVGQAARQEAPKPSIRVLQASADSLLSDAEARAAQEHKKVFLIFHASWCGWCHKLDGFLSEPKVAKIIGSNYVVLHIDVLENPDKKTLENAGGEDKMKQYGGENAGLPFTAVLDAHGKMLVNSNLTDKAGSNIGYPAQPQEVAHFMKMLTSTAPHLRASESAEIQQWLTAPAPKATGAG